VAGEDLEDAAGLGRIAAIVAKMALDGVTSQLPIVSLAQAPSTPAVQLRIARTRQHPRAHRARRALEDLEDVAGSGWIVAIVAKLALGGATSLLPIVPLVPAPSTPALQLRIARARRAPHRAHGARRALQDLEDAAASGLIAAIVAKMALGGAISLLLIVPVVPESSTQTVRGRAAVEPVVEPRELLLAGIQMATNLGVFASPM